MSFTDFLEYRLLDLIRVQDFFEVLAILAISRLLIIGSIKTVRHYCERFELPAESSKVIRQAVRVFINFFSFLIPFFILILLCLKFPDIFSSFRNRVKIIK